MTTACDELATGDCTPIEYALEGVEHVVFRLERALRQLKVVNGVGVTPEDVLMRMQIAAFDISAAAEQIRDREAALQESLKDIAP